MAKSLKRENMICELDGRGKYIMVAMKLFVDLQANRIVEKNHNTLCQDLAYSVLTDCSMPRCYWSIWWYPPGTMYSTGSLDTDSASGRPSTWTERNIPAVDWLVRIPISKLANYSMAVSFGSYSFRVGRRWDWRSRVDWRSYGRMVWGYSELCGFPEWLSFGLPTNRDWILFPSWWILDL